MEAGNERGKAAEGGEAEKCEDRADALFLFLPTCDVTYNIHASLKINKEDILVINADFCYGSNIR